MMNPPWGGGKSWNLSEAPHIYEAVKQGELFQGSFGAAEPAVVLPILVEGVPEAVILIKKLPYESESLYHMNLLKTLSLLLRDCMDKALQHEDLVRAERYIPDTDILNPEAFNQQVQLAVEKADKNLAPYCLIEFVSADGLEKVANVASQTLRTTDYLGISPEGNLLALLNNTEIADLEHLQKRIAPITIQLVGSNQNAGANA